jgi:hypothetical protein
MPKNLIHRPVGSGLLLPPEVGFEESLLVGGRGGIVVVDSVPSEAYPNEPAGATPWFQHDYQTFPLDGLDVAASDAGFFKMQGTNTQGLHHVTLIDDPTAPHGKGKSLRVRRPANHTIGTGVFNFTVRSSLSGVGSPQDHTPLRKVYISYWTMYEADGNGEWSVQSGQWRQFKPNRQWPTIGQPGFTFRAPAEIGTSEFPVLLDAWDRYRFWGSRFDGGSTVTFDPEPSPAIPIGSWHHIEIIYDRVGSEPLYGSGSDGVGSTSITLWVDGTLLRDSVDNEVYEEDPFVELHWNYNPSSGQDSDREDWIRIGDLYISGEVYTGSSGLSGING